MQYPPIVDLHVHSTASDGTYTPEEVAKLAKTIGLSAIALTDHDTIDGLDAFQKTGNTLGIETITGIEFAALWEKHHRPEIHIVGLGFDPDHPALLERMKDIQTSRDIRNQKMCEKLSSIGLHISLDEVAANAGGEIITRAHFANVLLKKGYIAKKEDAFSRYISTGLPGYVEREFLSPELCIRTIKEAGGAAVLAHPTLYGLNMAQLEELCEELIPYGLDGIECQYSTYSSAETKTITALAEKMNLLPSGGSDFHGKNKPNIHLGSGKSNLAIPYIFWE
ncbi:MAG: PHP domain-containing protein, partial [Anaerotignum sp.]|nr:PHP domain-containing protein [Anaerotignum sp.]